MIDDRISRLRGLADCIRRTAVEMAHDSGRHGAHLGGSLSAVEIYAVLYGEILNIRPTEPLWSDRDRMVAGKEHARLAEYPAMVEAGLIRREDLKTYIQDGGLLAGHPLRPDLGLEYCCCSLGMALPVAVGMALDAKRSGRRHKVYTIMGDGEMDEGLIWEAILAAAQFKLDNLVAVVDRNGLSSDGDTEKIMALENLQAKFEAFGWKCVVADGHDVESLLDAFETPMEEGKPLAVIARTVKGKGLSFAENNPGWHQNVMTDELYEKALQELKVSRNED